nr:MAG TPA: Siroheme biosynthesis protein [Bacteriophage sp.]
MLTRVAMVGNSLFVVVLGLCGEVRIGVTTDGQGCENLV